MCCQLWVVGCATDNPQLTTDESFLKNLIISHLSILAKNSGCLKFVCCKSISPTSSLPFSLSPLLPFSPSPLLPFLIKVPKHQLPVQKQYQLEYFAPRVGQDHVVKRHQFSPLWPPIEQLHHNLHRLARSKSSEIIQ